MAFLGVSLKNNKEQQELARLMYENNRPIIMVEGAAGTGKALINGTPVLTTVG